MTTPTSCEGGLARAETDCPGPPRRGGAWAGRNAGACPLPERETERVRLRQFSPDDLGALAPILADPEVMTHLGLRGEAMTRPETETALMGIISHWRRKGFGRWAAEDKRTGRLMGFAGLRSFGRWAELVYLLDRPWWGRGIATEMARECLRFAFSEKGFANVVAFTRPANLASRRVLEKVGMRYEGTGELFRLLEEAGDGYAKPEGADDIVVSIYSSHVC